MKRFVFFLILLLPIVSVGQYTVQREWHPSLKIVTGEYIRSYDGDGVRVRQIKGKKLRIVERSYRLIAIDAPERATRQPYWEESQKSITEMLAGKSPTLEVRGFDTVYRRRLVKVLVNDVDIGLEQVRRGAAWYLPLYGKSLSDEEKAQYAAAQEEAKAAKRGLWALPKPIEPRIWRKHHRK